MKSSLRLIVVLLVCGSLLSCRNSSVVRGTPIHFSEPEKIITLDKDATFDRVFLEEPPCADLQIVKDSILVLKRQSVEDNQVFFDAYSTNSFERLGSFIRKGRGPGELISPNLAKTSVNCPFLCLNDNPVGRSFLVDVEESISQNRMSNSFDTDLPLNPIDWIPLSYDRQLCLNLNTSGLLFNIIDYNGVALKTIQPFEGINAQRSMTKLSCLVTSNWPLGRAAFFMVCFPQLFIIDSKGDYLTSIAVDKKHIKWREDIDFHPDMESIMNSIEYYIGITSSPDIIIAAFSGHSIRDNLSGGNGTHLHVFNWEGSFLYDISVREDIERLALDPNSFSLYCIEKKEGKVIRYDLSTILTSK